MTARKQRALGVTPDERFELERYDDAEEWLYIILWPVFARKITHQ